MIRCICIAAALLVLQPSVSWAHPSPYVEANPWVFPRNLGVLIALMAIGCVGSLFFARKIGLAPVAVVSVGIALIFGAPEFMGAMSRPVLSGFAGWLFGVGG